METRYWVRDASLSGLVGPLSLADLRAAVLAKSLPYEAEVCPERADGRQPGDLDPWLPAYELLGFEPPPRVRPARAGSAGAAGRRDSALAGVRARTRYPGSRRLLGVVACAASIVVLVVMVLSLGIVRGGEVGGIVVLTAVLQMGGIWVIYNALVMLADLADCALRRDAEATAAPK